MILTPVRSPWESFHELSPVGDDFINLRLRLTKSAGQAGP